MIFRSSKSKRRNQRASKQREARRRKVANLASRAPHLETLEDRRLLAVVSYDAASDALTFTADAGDADDVTIVGDNFANTLQILVGNGDAITLAGDANAGNGFVLSTTVTANDTLTIDAATSPLEDGTFNLGDMNDTLNASAENGVFINSLTFNGEAGVDNLTGTALADTLVGGPGNDIILAGDGNDLIIWNNGDGSDTIDGQGDDDTVQVNGADGSGDEFAISASGARLNVERTNLGLFALDIGGVEELDLNTFAGEDEVVVDDLTGVADLDTISLVGGDDIDDFNVTPSTLIDIEIDGGAPTGVIPGDSLFVETTGTTGAAFNVGGTGGNVTFTSGELPIAFTEIETFEGADPVVLGSGADNDFIVRINAADPTLLEVVIDGNAISFPIATIAALTINGDDGDDELLIDYANGDPVPAGGLTFDGGDEVAGDSLIVDNPAPFNMLTVTHTGVSADGFDGTVQADAGGLITFTGLEPVTLGPSVNLTINLPDGGSNTGTLQNSGVAGQSELVDNGASFEDVIFDNPSNSLTVNLGDSSDALQVNTLDAGYAASLIINGGVGTDDVELNNVDLINTPGRGLWVTGTETLDITGGTISGNTAMIGGGILIDDANTTATIDGTTISGNTATGAAATDGGGGIFNNGANLTIENGAQITNNVANGTAGSGGGIFNAVGGTLTVTGSTISGNSANRAGGGIEDASGNTTLVTLDDVVLDNNQAISGPGNGGGLHVTGPGDVSITDGSVSGNSAALEGGGLWNGTGTMTIDGTTIDGNTASGAAADDGGGGIFNNGGVVNIGQLTPVDITNNVADGASGSGGGILNLGGTLDVTDGTISGNSANRAGGGIEDNATPGTTLVTLTDVTVSNNNTGPAPGNGGGLHITGLGTVNVIGGSFSGNTASQEGGGLWNSSTGFLSIDGTQIDGNTAESANAAGDAQGGGGIFNDGGVLNVDNAFITNNVALDPDAGSTNDDGGGGIFNNGGTLTINATDIAGNTATDGLGNGGGLLSIGGSNALDQATTVSNNLAARAGGGIEVNAASITIDDSSIDSNSAGINGGGLHVTGAGDVQVTLSQFVGNTAGNEGGGLWNSASGTVDIDDSQLLTNTADFGGGIFNDGAAGDITITDSQVVGNSANLNGGGIDTEGGLVTIAGSAISTNVASGAAAPNEGGGGIYISGGTVAITGSNIDLNTADGTSGSGGGILNFAGNLTVTNSVLAGNAANRAGGGIEANAGSDSTITDTRITGNDAGTNPGNGGGIHITSSGIVAIDGSTVDNNTANEGGGLWNSGSGTFSITNTTISGNTATGSSGGGIFNTDGGTITTDSVTITLNTGVGGSGVDGGTSGVTLENTIVAQNPGGGIEDNLAGVINSNDYNLIGDPRSGGNLTGLLVNTIFEADALLLPLANNGGPTPTHLPGAGSPAIGLGLTNLLVDQRDVNRPQGAQDDIGAVEVDLNGFRHQRRRPGGGHCWRRQSRRIPNRQRRQRIDGQRRSVRQLATAAAHLPQSDHRRDRDPRLGGRRDRDHRHQRRTDRHANRLRR